MLQLDLKQITTDTPVVGFTGALGGGCTYMARGLEQHYGYRYGSLSEPIHRYARENKLPETTESLQNIGNQLRREFGLDYLVGLTLADLVGKEPQKAQTNGPRGIVIDGIRNVGEIAALQQLPHFYLISVQAERSIREGRTVGAGKRFKTKEEFEAADKRDQDEQTTAGQQVKACNDLSDIIIINEKDVSPKADGPYRDYLKSSIYNDYVSLMEQGAKGAIARETQAQVDDTLMTIAYVESKRSSCLKRKVGAVIASSSGEILAVGHNDVPPESEPCIRHPTYGWCARDCAQEQLGRQYKFCPACGAPLAIKTLCPGCKSEITEFAKRCPSCRSPVDIEHNCSKCGCAVFRSFLPGAGASESGKLLDLCRALHAEENAILNLTRSGARLFDVSPAALDPKTAKAKGRRRGPVLYSTTFPCNLCAKKIAAIGIRELVYAEPYTMTEAAEILRQEGVDIRRFQGVKSRAFFRLYA